MVITINRKNNKLANFSMKISYQKRNFSRPIVSYILSNSNNLMIGLSRPNDLLIKSSYVLHNKITSSNVQNNRLVNNTTKGNSLVKTDQT